MSVADSQLDKLRAALLDSKETYVISEQILGKGGGELISSAVAYRPYVLRKSSFICR